MRLWKRSRGKTCCWSSFLCLSACEGTNWFLIFREPTRPHKRLYFRLLNRQSRLVLDVAGWGTRKGTPLILFPAKHAPERFENQLFYENKERGTIVSVYSGMCIEVTGKDSRLDCPCDKKKAPMLRNYNHSMFVWFLRIDKHESICRQESRHGSLHHEYGDAAVDPEGIPDPEPIQSRLGGERHWVRRQLQCVRLEIRRRGTPALGGRIHVSLELPISLRFGVLPTWKKDKIWYFSFEFCKQWPGWENDGGTRACGFPGGFSTRYSSNEVSVCE